MNPEYFYVTTPIYYVNDVPHIGHAYTTIAADVLARFHRHLGHRVFFLTGTDEHGQKIEQAALEKGETPIELANRVVARFRSLWRNPEHPEKALNISYDDFIRTTEPRHKDRVRDFFEKVQSESIHGKSIIYKGEYEDWYCTPCETFLTEMQLQDGKCPTCHREVKKLKESSYFFRLSEFGQILLDGYQSHADCILPQSRMNETKSFVEGGLKDLSLSRNSFSWGIPVPNDEKHVIYVWFDALFNYMTALYDSVKDPEECKKFWGNSLHLVGKDILRFHAVYWPAFLHAAHLPAPKMIFAHGWWTNDGKKMSKSLGNVVDPYAMVEKYGADPFRYFLLAEVPFGQDGDFSIPAMERRINADLANNLGNLFSRTINLVLKQREGVVPHPDKDQMMRPDAMTYTALIRFIEGDATEKPALLFLTAALKRCAFSEALRHFSSYLDRANDYVDKMKPWEKTGRDPREIDTILFSLIESLRLISLMIYPFMPTKAQAMWENLNLPGKISDIQNLSEIFKWGLYPAGTTLQKPNALFPRIEVKK